MPSTKKVIAAPGFIAFVAHFAIIVLIAEVLCTGQDLTYIPPECAKSSSSNDFGAIEGCVVITGLLSWFMLSVTALFDHATIDFPTSSAAASALFGVDFSSEGENFPREWDPLHDLLSARCRLGVVFFAFRMTYRVVTLCAKV